MKENITELRAWKEEIAYRVKYEKYKYYEPNGKCEEFINKIGSGKYFIVLFNAANGVGKTCVCANIVAHLIWGKDSDNEYFNLPLFKNFPFPKKGRIASDPTNIEKNLIPTLEEWFPKGRYKSRKGGKHYNSIFETDNDFDFDIMSYDQDPKEYEGATLGWCIEENERVLVDSGEWKEIKNIKVGDYVLNTTDNFRKGKHKVVAVYDKGIKDIIKIKTRSGFELKCTPDHKIWVSNRGWIEAGKLKKGDRLYSPVFNIKGTKKITNKESFMLGSWIGDGWFDKSLFIAIANKQFLKEVSNKVEKISHKSKYDYRIVDKKLRQLIIDCGLKGKKAFNKFIPDIIFKEQLDNQIEFLKGLYSTDGWFSGHSIGYGTTSKRLAEDLRLLLNNLGIRAGIYDKKSQKQGKWRDQYWVMITQKNNIKKFCELVNVSSKKDMQEKVYQEALRRIGKTRGTERSKRDTRKSIISIEKAGKARVYDISVEGEHSFICNGLRVSNCWFDEPPPQSIFKATVSRMRKGGIIFISETPIDDNAAWLYDHIIANPDKDMEAKGQRAYVEADVESACFDKDTEILTQNGWKDFNDIEIGENIVSMDKNSKTLVYSPIKNIIKKEWNNDLIDIGQGILATPDHRMLVLNSDKGKNRTTKEMPFETIEAKDLRRGHRMLPFVDNGFVPTVFQSPFPDKINSEDWCEFMGWYLAEGWCNGTKGGKALNYGIGISQCKDKIKIEHIKKLLSRTNWKWRFSEKTGLFRTNDKELYLHLFPLGNSHNKYIPRYLFEYPKQCLKKLWYGLVMGDGDGDKRYFTVSEKLADDVQELLFRMEYKSSNKQWTDNRTNVKIKGKLIKRSGLKMNCVRRGKKRYYYISKRPQKIFYNGVVSCVSVDTDIIVVRNKKEKQYLITHNCKIHGVRGHLEHSHIEKMIAEYDEDEKQARIYGKFHHLVGMVYKQFSREIHVIRPFNINYEDYVVYEALDPHPRNPDMVNWIAVDRKGRKFIVDELWLKCQGGTEELSQRIKEKAQQYRIGRRIIDPSAFIKDQHTQHSLADRLSSYGLNYIEAGKNRSAADKRLGDALNYQKKENEFIVSPEIFIFDNCHRTIWEIEHYRWDNWVGKTADKRNKKEKPVDKDDHSIENVGRILIQEPQFHEMETLIPQSGYDIEKDDPYLS